MLGLDSPTGEEPSAEMGSVTPKAKKLNLEIPPDEDGTPPASGSTTPTATTLDEKKSRPFLGLSFPDFLRGRYPSTSRASVKGVPENLEAGRSQVNASGSNESGELDVSETPGDQVGNVKPPPVDLEVPTRIRHEDGREIEEEGIEHKLEESTPIIASVHIQ
jgi:hypothetical protein